MESINNNRSVNVILFIFGFLSLIFIFYSKLDIEISKLFFSGESGFLYKDNTWAFGIYIMLPLITKIFIIYNILYIIYIFTRHYNIKNIFKSGSFFLLICILLVPGLTVNTLLKDNFGRARPREVIEFNGDKHFTAAFSISDQCRKNCSFSSGHAAMGFYYSAIAYIVNRRYFFKIYLTGVFLGLIVGFSRIVMGGHFAGDVVASGFVVLTLNHLIYLLWIRRTHLKI